MREIILDEMKDIPFARAFLAVLMLTGARANEILPNPKYKTALLTTDMSTINLAHTLEDGRKLPMVRIPITLKKRTKKEAQFRYVPIFDYELYQVYIDYLKMRLRWEKPLNNSWFNPVNFVEFMEEVARIRSPKKLKEKIEKNKVFRAKYKFYKRYKWLFLTDTDKILDKLIARPYEVGISALKKYLKKNMLVNKVVFPITYWGAYKEINRIKISDELYDIPRKMFIEGIRGFYTHYGREYFVNKIMEFGLDAPEIMSLMGWANIKNLNYYIRPEIVVKESIATKLLSKMDEKVIKKLTGEL